MSDQIAALLLAWYDRHARTLPWRGINDPYRTWVSETMLQQTRVETVIGYYERFLNRFPTVTALAEAPEEEVVKLWEGLGYYSRARNLHKGAKQVAEAYGGVLPADVDSLRKISGIGPYTAGAIASIAYGQPVPAVDGNVIRVVSRLAGIRENVGIPSVRRALEAAAGKLIPAERPGDFNQALMDLGSAVCTPGTPACERCPLQAKCDAYAAGDAEDLPVLPRKNPPKVIEYTLCLVFSGDRVLMRQRSESLLHGLWVFPMLEGKLSLRQAQAQIRKQLKLVPEEIVPAGEARHVFTHQIWEMTLLTMQVQEGEKAPAGYRFVTGEEMASLTVPTAVKAAVKVVRDRWQKKLSEQV